MPQAHQAGGWLNYCACSSGMTLLQRVSSPCPTTRFGQRSPACRFVAGDTPYAVSREAYAIIAGLRQLAAAEAASAPPEGANKKLPESLRLALSEEFIGPYMRYGPCS